MSRLAPSFLTNLSILPPSPSPSSADGAPSWVVAMSVRLSRANLRHVSLSTLPSPSSTLSSPLVFQGLIRTPWPTYGKTLQPSNAAHKEEKQWFPPGWTLGLTQDPPWSPISGCLRADCVSGSRPMEKEQFRCCTSLTGTNSTLSCIQWVSLRSFIRLAFLTIPICLPTIRPSLSSLHLFARCNSEMKIRDFWSGILWR